MEWGPAEKMSQVKDELLLDVTYSFSARTYFSRGPKCIWDGGKKMRETDLSRRVWQQLHKSEIKNPSRQRWTA